MTAARQPAPVEAPTERRHPRSRELDLMPTQDLLRLINDEDAQVPAAVAAALPAIEAAVDLAVTAMTAGGSVHYFGAGTSGRIAAMDAAELPPTFGLPPERVVAHHAGGAAALDTALEDVEDDQGSGATDADALSPGDLAIGLTASGRTPYVAGALGEARRIGVPTVLVSANPAAEAAAHADVHICVDTGPEVLAGSTRMKAGTAQKLVLNAFSTAVMVRLGHTYAGLMTGVVAKNAKLHGRMVGILAEASGADLDTSAPRAPRLRSRPQAGAGAADRRRRRRPRTLRPRRRGRRRPHRPAPPRHHPQKDQRKELNMQRSKLGIVAAGLGVALLAACAPSTDSASGGDGEGTTLEVWSWRTEDVDEYEKIFDAYEAEHEGVTVEFKPYVATEYDTILSTGLSAEGGPDVAQLRAYGGLQPLCEAGRLVELEAEDVDTSAISDDVLTAPAARATAASTASRSPARRWSSTTTRRSSRSNGLEEPKTWDELMEVSSTLQDADVTPYAVTGKDNWVLPMLHDLFAAPRYGGPEFEQAVQSGKADFTDPDYVASIETMEEVTPYFPEDVVGVDYATAQTLFTSEKAAMYPGGSFELAFFQEQNPDLDMGVFAVPPPPGAVVDETMTPGWVDASFGVNSQSPDQEEALELVRWMASEEYGQMVSDELKQLNPVEGVTPGDPLLQEISELYTASPTPYLLLQDFRYGEPTGTDLMAAGLQEMLLGDSDAQAVSEKLQKGVAQWFEPDA